MSSQARIKNYIDNNVPFDPGRSQHDILLFGEASFQSRRIRLTDTTLTSFGITNFGLGVKYRWQCLSVDKKNKFGVDAGIGFSYLQIDKQRERNFNSVISPETPSNELPPIFRGVNFLADVQFNDMIFYARIYTPISVNGHVSYIRDIFFSTGIKVTGEFFSF